MKTKVFLSVLLFAASSSSLANTEQFSPVFDSANKSPISSNLSIDSASAVTIKKSGSNILSTEKINMDGVPCLTWPVCKDTNQ